MNLSIIIFCYNEQGTLQSVAENTIRFLQTFSPAYEIVIVDDGSTDSSGAIAQALATQHPSIIKVITHPQNLGIGMALRSGYATARMEYICAIPADGQFAITQLSVLKPFTDNAYYSFYRRTTHYTFYRKVLSWFNRLYNQHLLGIYLRDVNWIKVYRLSQLQKVNPQLTSSIVESEICAKLYKLGALPVEIPSDYLERKHGVSKGGGLKTVMRALAETGKLFWVVKHFKANN
jgi:glycosyltransferase involved in cell wall biosynthesis